MAAFVSTQYVLDTGTFLDYLALRHKYDHSAPWPNRDCNLVTMTTDADRANFEKLLSLHRGSLYTVSGVVAELQHHILMARRNETLAKRPAFMNWCWSLLHSTLQTYDIDEILRPLRSLPQAAVITIGPVDIGIVELAKSLIARGEQVSVLTGDRKLRKLCRKESVSAPFVTDAMRSALGT
jgi:hypothetical protein